MENNKIIELMKDPNFVKEVTSQESVADVQKLFKSKGVELSEADVEALGDIIDTVAQKGSVLSDEEIEKVSAGISVKGAEAIGGIVGGLTGALVGLTTGTAIGVGAAGAKPAHDLLKGKPVSLSSVPGKVMSGTLIGMGVGTAGGIAAGAASGVGIARSLCRWKKK